MTREEQIKKAAFSADNNLHAYPHPVPGVADMLNNYFAMCFKAGAEWADKHPKWIPVEEYPKVDISCTLLVHYVDGTIDICDYYGDFYDYTGENVTRNVTHWMEIVPPRKEGSND